MKERERAHTKKKKGAELLKVSTESYMSFWIKKQD